MCNAKAKGLMQPWIPNLNTTPGRASPAKEKPEGSKAEKGGKGNKGMTSKPSLNNLTVDPEGTNDLKEAIEVRAAGLPQRGTCVKPVFLW